ncbi:hypothetical protein SAMN05518854_11726 [Variovorax sp. YR266]|nr:hypothetical protein SAMN05518854_11726 [Variovorax sp. YR266]
MSQADFFSSEPAVLYTPAWYSDTAREVQLLPLAPGDYKVTPSRGAERWTVTSLKDGSIAYSGIGPVEVTQEAAAICSAVVSSHDLKRFHDGDLLRPYRSPS